MLWWFDGVLNFDDRKVVFGSYAGFLHGRCFIKLRGKITEEPMHATRQEIPFVYWLTVEYFERFSTLGASVK